MDSEELGFLVSPAGERAVADAAARSLSDGTLVADVAALRAAHGDGARAAVELVRARRRAEGKLDAPHTWLLDSESLQQATPSAVASHRAARLAGLSVHDVTCSIGAELRALTAVCPRVVASDLDEVRAAMAARNVPRALVFRADALDSTSGADVVIADPARRAGGRRIVDPERMVPPLSALLAAYGGRSLAVKTAPGIDYDLLYRSGFAGEVEVTSLDGGVREACLWSGPVAVPGLRRASVLRRGGGGFEVTSNQRDDVEVASAGKYLIEPDGAVIRAGLVRHYGFRHDLWQLDPHIAYLTGDSVPHGVRGFEVLEELPFSEKNLRAALRARDVGTVEILTRGAGIDPDALRRRLKPAGTHSLTVVIARIGRGVTAWLCRPTR
ncbi:class I SAM-dependent methyltransferase [Tsukamurella sp. 8F]|uniref:THUMP-like domain-containing protein n=1 Tax=unclassified Tsukamurella TaxID=2633480 RepID=UPI0023B8E4FE|nr:MULTISPECIES: class I SAM-dependent methyltransferase [unclassified Tsukamurella]MDF0529764.1 class I SAM-dependent methyltransferase [Tsukamurella sp. 8J]MDF0586049.1 class I SAM-dependent methyltransferase [Tsukamurella sp. 8F]